MEQKDVNAYVNMALAELMIREKSVMIDQLIADIEILQSVVDANGYTVTNE
jgi:hypothetical protein